MSLEAMNKKNYMLMVFGDGWWVRKITSFIDLLKDIDFIDGFTKEVGIFDKKSFLRILWLFLLILFVLNLLHMIVAWIFVESPVMVLDIDCLHIFQ